MLCVTVLVSRLHKFNCSCRHCWNCHDMGEVSRLMQSQSDQNIQWKHVKYSNSSTDSQCSKTNSSISAWKDNPSSKLAFCHLFQPWQKKLRKSGNDSVQSQQQVNQKRLKSVQFGNLNCFNQIQFWLKRLIPIEHDLGCFMLQINWG